MQEKMKARLRESRLQGGDSKGHNFIAPIIAQNGALIIAQKVPRHLWSTDLVLAIFERHLTLPLTLTWSIAPTYQIWYLYLIPMA